jgi:putative tricarboxylic transport membrane protein
MHLDLFLVNLIIKAYYFKFGVCEMVKDRALSLAIGLFIVVMSIESIEIAGKSNWQTHSSAFYPRVLLVVMGVLATILFVKSFTHKKKSEEKVKRSLKTLWLEYNKIFILFVCFGGYVFILTKVGFIVSTALYLFISQAVLTGLKEKKKLVLNLAVTIIATFTIFAIFNYGLNVWLP